MVPLGGGGGGPGCGASDGRVLRVSSFAYRLRPTFDPTDMMTIQHDRHKLLQTQLIHVVQRSLWW